MAEKVLAMTVDGRITYCKAPPEKRGLGRCKHSVHAFEGETVEDFMARVSDSIHIDYQRTNQEIIDDLIKENRIDNGEPINPDWNEYITPLVYKYLTLGDEHCVGGCQVETRFNEYGDEVDHLTLDVEFRGERYTCDFGDIPHVQENGTFSIKGTDYRCIPVVGRNKVGYGQGYSAEGKPTIWLFQKDGNMGMTIPVEDGKVKILGKFYDKDEIEKAIIEGHHDDPKVDSIIRSLDPWIKKRFPEFGEEGWMSKMSENFRKDEINDLEYRRVFTYKDMVGEELEMQLRRMGVTFRNNLSSEDGNSNGKVVITQKNNTENIIDNLSGRSNVQLAENINPLAAYSQANKVSLVGREGYNKDQCPESLRYPGESFKGITDPLDQSSGKSIGLNVFLKNSSVKDGVLQKSDQKTKSLSDFVPYRNHNNPNRVSMATSQLRQAMILKDGEDPRRIGDPISDAAWGSISGANMGRNARVAWLPGEAQWEDSCQISESFAKKLTAYKTFNYSDDPKWKEGDQIKPGDIIAGREVKYAGTLKRKPGGHGFTVESEVPFRVGDKIAGRYGDKNTVGRIVPDSEMPQVYDEATKSYQPAEIIRSPLSVGKRGNLGTIFETQNAVDESGNVNLSTKNIKPVKLKDGKTVKANNGEMFIMRLNQVSKEKNYGYGGHLEQDGEFHSRWGEMESILLTTTEDRRKVLRYLRSQGNDEKARMDSLLHSIGVTRI